MAAQAAGGDGGMHVFALPFVVVALKALGGIGLWVERDWMDRGGGRDGEQCEQWNENPRRSDGAGAGAGAAAAQMNCRFITRVAILEESHTAFIEKCKVRELRRAASARMQITTR